MRTDSVGITIEIELEDGVQAFTTPESKTSRIILQRKTRTAQAVILLPTPDGDTFFVSRHCCYQL